MSVEDKLYLVTALALLGDDAGVNEWLSQNKQALSTEKDENVLYTCLCRLLTLAVIREDAEMTQMLLEEVVERDNAYISPAFALATYLSRVQPPEQSAAVVSYTIDGQRRELTFETSWIQTMKLSEKELLEADFKVEKGEVSYRLCYTDTLTEDIGDGDVQLQQQYEVQEATVGDLVKLTLKMSGDEVAEFGTLSAVIPSGMRYVGLDGAARNAGLYLIEEEGGRLKFRLSGHGAYTINLYVRCVLPGDYYAEAPTFADETSGSFTVGTGTQVRIHEKN